jgi:hypothetical protein
MILRLLSDDTNIFVFSIHMAVFPDGWLQRSSSVTKTSEAPDIEHKTAVSAAVPIALQFR